MFNGKFLLPFRLNLGWDECAGRPLGAVLLPGVYHGLNSGMGWPMAVSAVLMERKRSALSGALAALAIGHFLSMSMILLPFSIMAGYIAPGGGRLGGRPWCLSAE